MNILLAKRKADSSKYRRLIDDIFSEESKKGIKISNEDSADDIAKVIAEELVRIVQKDFNKIKISL